MSLKLNTGSIKEEDKALAISVRNHIRNGLVVIGSPGLGLKKTLIELENKNDSREFSLTDWQNKDAQLIARICATKAGIEGEIQLCDYLSALLKYDKSLEGIIAFASLSYEQENNNLDYIPDTDVLLVYGRHLLIIDAKNIKTKSNETYFIAEDGVVIDEKQKVILQYNTSNRLWKEVMENADIDIDSISALVCIVNNTETDIMKDENWKLSTAKLIHISELKSYLKYWIKDKDNTLYLDILTEISKAQIKEDKKIDLDVAGIKKKFGI